MRLNITLFIESGDDTKFPQNICFSAENKCPPILNTSKIGTRGDISESAPR